MMFDDTAVGGLFMVGAGTPVALGTGDDKIRGGAYVEGPLQVGRATGYSSVEATLQIAPLRNPDSDSPDNTLYVKGNTTHEGDYTHQGDMTQRGDYNHRGDVSHIGDSTHIGCFTVSSPPGCDSVFNGNINTTGWVHADQEVTTDTYVQAPTGYFSGTVTAANFVGTWNGYSPGSFKSFDIPHPSKKGWRLRHVCPEGPSADVYLRGRVRNINEIRLPEYWKDFVDINSISVSLTPIGSHQDVIIKRIEDNKIVLQSKGGMPIDCFFHIYGERKDGERLIAEYPGESAADYPGNNSQYSVSSFHYDQRA